MLMSGHVIGHASRGIPYYGPVDVLVVCPVSHNMSVSERLHHLLTV